MRAVSGISVAWLVVACGSSSPPSSTTAPPSETTATTTTTTTAAVPVGAPYELHEWGVVDVPESGNVEISAGAGQPERPMSVRKPVVYVHLLDGATETTFGLRVTLGAGGFVEHAPAASVSGTTLEWPSVVARAAHCGVAADASRDATARRLPLASCGTADRICEVDELPRYDAPSSACLDVSGTQTGLLFYRGQAPSAPLPLTTSRAADLTLTVTASAAMGGAPGGLVRLSTALSGPWPQGRVVVSRAAFPGAGQSVTMPVGTEVITRDGGMAELRASLVAIGLTDDEASAFLAGWADELFGIDPSARETRDRDVSGLRLQDVLLYFLPEPAIDAIATLTPTPAPRAVHRAFLVRIDLGGVPTG